MSSIKQKIEKLLERAVEQAEEFIEDGELVDEGLDMLVKVTAAMRNLTSQPPAGELPDPEMKAKNDEDLIELARRAAKSNT